MDSARRQGSIAPVAGLVPPQGFPAPGEPTFLRKLLDEITAVTAPPPPYVTRFALPSCVAWAYGHVLTEFTSTDRDVVVTGDVLFGGYIASLVDQQAGLAMYTVLPDDRTLLTVHLDLAFRKPLRSGAIRIESTVRELTSRQAVCEVVLSQDGVETSRGLVTESIREDRGDR